VICFHVDSSPGQVSAWKVKLLRNAWVIKEEYYQGWTQSGMKHWRNCTCTYGNKKDGVPLLTNYESNYGRFDPDGTERIVQKIQYEVTQLIPGAVDLSEFDVYQFLPPKVKIGEIKPAGLSCYHIAGIAIGIILILLGIYLKVMAMNVNN
jgi:hypothetical protein